MVRLVHAAALLAVAASQLPIGLAATSDSGLSDVVRFHRTIKSLRSCRLRGRAAGPSATPITFVPLVVSTEVVCPASLPGGGALQLYYIAATGNTDTVAGLLQCNYVNFDANGHNNCFYKTCVLHAGRTASDLGSATGRSLLATTLRPMPPTALEPTPRRTPTRPRPRTSTRSARAGREARR